MERSTRIRASQIHSILPSDIEVTIALGTGMDGYIPSYDESTGKFEWVANSSVVGSSTYATSFNDGNLETGNILTVSHNLNISYPSVVIYDNNGNIIEPDEITYSNVNTVLIDLSSFAPLTGTWNVRVVGGTFTQSLLKDDDSDTSVDVEKTADIDKIYFKIAGQEQVVLQDGALLPILNNDVDLGSSSYKFKDGYFAGKLTVDGLIDPIGLALTEQSSHPFGTGQKGLYIKTSTNKLMYYDGATEEEIGAGALSDLSDVELDTGEPTDGQALIYDGSTGVGKWKPGIISAGGAKHQIVRGFELANNKFDLDYDIDIQPGTLYHDDTEVNLTALTTIQYDDHSDWIDSAYYFGAYYGRFNGSTAYLSSVDHADWDILSQTNFTIDMLVKFQAFGTLQYLIGQYEDVNNVWYIYKSTSNYIVFYVISGGSTIVSVVSTTTITDTNWHHVALCKVGNTYGIYLDGIQIAYTSDSDTDTFAGTLQIGRWGAGSNYFQGNMDEIRLTHDNIFSASPVDLSATGATPDTITVPTVAHSGGGNCKLLLHLENNTTDSSGTSKTVSNSNVTYAPNSAYMAYVYVKDDGTCKFSDYAPSYLDTDGNRIELYARFANTVSPWNTLTIPDHTDWDLGTGDFTIEGWIRPLNSTSNTWSFVILDDTNRAVQCYYSNKYIYFGLMFNTTSGSRQWIYTPGRWYHLAMVRSSGSISFWVNGVQLGTSIAGATSISASQPGLIGAYAGTSGLYKGDMDEIRISNVARYSTTFAPSRTFTSDSNTKLLLHMDGNLIDSGNTGHQIYTTPGRLDISFGLSLYEGVPLYHKDASNNYWRCIGAVRVDSDGTIDRFRQNGNTVLYEYGIRKTTTIGTGLTIYTISCDTEIPSIAKKGIFGVYIGTATNLRGFFLKPGDFAGTTAWYQYDDAVASKVAGSNQFDVNISETTNIKFWWYADGISDFALGIHGYIMNIR